MAIGVDAFQDFDEARERSAYTALYERTYPDLVAYCRRRLGGSGDAEAVAQEVLLRAWTSWSLYDRGKPFWPWVAKIARCACIDERRRRMARVTEQPLADLKHAEPAHDDSGRYVERLSALAAFGGMPETQRRLLLRRALEGWSYASLAEAEGVSVVSMRGAICRARRSLLASYERATSGLAALAPIAYLTDCRRRYVDSSVRLQPWLSTARLSAEGIMATTVAMISMVSLVAGSAGLPPTRDHALVSRSGTPEIVAAKPDTVATADMPTTGKPGPQGDDAQTLDLGPVSVPPNGEATPDDVAFDSFAASRDGQHVFAVGSLQSGCDYPPCSAMFTSRNGGETWTRLPALGFTAGRLLLPPSYPDDDRIFSASLTALQVSTDGGLTFTNISPVGGPAAISPGFDDDHAQILIGGVPGWEHDVSTGITAPLALVPPPPGIPYWLLPASSYPSDGRLLIGSLAPSPTDELVPTISLCVNQACRITAEFGPPGSSPSIWHSRDERIVLAWAAGSMVRSTDGGETFSPVALPGISVVTSVAEDDSGTIHLAHAGLGQSGRSSGGVLSSADGGETWSSTVETDAVARGVEALVVLPGGRVIAGLSSGAGGGLSCSADGGLTWRPRCVN